MISIEEPKREFTEEESRQLRFKFITLLYTLLIVYLTLHQFLIPLANNLFKGRFFAADIHWFFIVHFYGYHQLKKTKEMSQGFYSFLWLVTILQTSFGFFTLGKWGLFSLGITQVSTILFLYFVWPFVGSDRNFKTIAFHALMAVLIFAGLKSIEVHSTETKRVTERRVVLHQEDFAISFPGKFQSESQASVWELGNQVFEFANGFKIVNDRDAIIDTRLYELKIKSDRVRWKYQRLAQLKPGEVWDLPLDKDSIYLVKSPERKDLKVLLLIPEGFKFPLGEGQLSVGFNSIEWRSRANE